MPEGPEVRVVTDYINEKILNKVLVSITSYIKKPLVGDEFLDCLPCEVSLVNCKGKRIFIQLTTSYNEEDDVDCPKIFYIWNHLIMTGCWSDKFSEKHTKYGLDFEDGSHLYFEDSRTFGKFSLISENDWEQELHKLGPDIMREPSFKTFMSRVDSKKKKQIGVVLLEQDFVSGIGNYLKAEILYHSYISPKRIVSSLSDEEWRKIHKHTLGISQDSYMMKGTSVKDFKGGSFQDKLVCYSQPKCPEDHDMKKYLASDGRRTWWCSECQK